MAGVHATHWGAGSAHSRTEPTSIEPLDVCIRRHIEAALTAVKGRIEGKEGAAAMLKINPHTLRAKMRKLKIDWASFRDRS